MFLQFMIEKPWLDRLTLSTTFYDFSVSHNLSAEAEMRKFDASGTNAYETVGNRRVKTYFKYQTNFIDFLYITNGKSIMF